MLAWGVGAILALGVRAGAIGVLVTPYLIDVIAPGFDGDRRELTIAVVRILFPCTGLLVMSAWCLGVLNSHHKFFMSYAAPVGIQRGDDRGVALLRTAALAGRARDRHRVGRGRGRGAADRRAGCRRRWRCCASIADRFPRRWRRSLRAVFNNLSFRWSPRAASANQRLHRQFTRQPVADRRGRGIQLWADFLHAAGEPVRAIRSRRRNCPRCRGRRRAMADDVEAMLRRRLNLGLRQIAFLVVPSAAAFFAIGDVIVALVYQSGAFHPQRRGLCVGGAGRLGRRHAREHDGPALQLGVLCAVGHPDAAEIRAGASHALVHPWILFAIPLPRLIGIAQTMGRARA